MSLWCKREGSPCDQSPHMRKSVQGTELFLRSTLLLGLLSSTVTHGTPLDWNPVTHSVSKGLDATTGSSVLSLAASPSLEDKRKAQAQLADPLHAETLEQHFASAAATITCNKHSSSSSTSGSSSSSSSSRIGSGDAVSKQGAASVSISEASHGSLHEASALDEEALSTASSDAKELIEANSVRISGPAFLPRTASAEAETTLLPSRSSPSARTFRSLLSVNSTPQCKSPSKETNTPLVWEPQPGKYLIMFCFRNQISNLIRCMHNHVLAAALLNRTLVVPEWIIFSERNLVLPPDWANETSPHHRKFDLRVLWDLAHMKRCLGPRHVMTVDEYSASQERPGPIRLSLIHCWFGKERPMTSEFMCCGYSSRGEIMVRLPSHPKKVTISMVDANLVGVVRWVVQMLCKRQDEAEPNCPAKVVPANRRGTAASLVPDPDYFARRFPYLDTVYLTARTKANASCMRPGVSVDSFLKEYSTRGSAAFEAPVLMVGELVNMRFEDKGGHLFPEGRWGHDPFVRIPGCTSRLLIQPAQALMEQARELQEDFFGGFPFVAVHWRRGDFIWYCDQSGTTRGRCTYTAPQAASCIAALLKAHGISRVFVATNAASREVIHFRRSLAQAMGGKVSIYHHVHLNPGMPRMRALAAQGIRVGQQRSLIGVTVDKILCALAEVFLGSRESTFTQDIQRLRVGLGTDSSCDSLVCQGQQEWNDTMVLQATKEVEFF